MDDNKVLIFIINCACLFCGLNSFPYYLGNIVTLKYGVGRPTYAVK
jgi:hypothetical protein